ncbi:MAG: hypothetical protein Q9226_006030, partial [Calogaya cf. arnoldii]
HARDKVLCKIRDVQDCTWAAEIRVVTKGENPSSYEFSILGEPQGPEIFGLPCERPGLQRRASKSMDKDKIKISLTGTV